MYRQHQTNNKNNQKNVIYNITGNNGQKINPDKMNGAMMINGVPHFPRPNGNTQRSNDLESRINREKNIRFRLKEQKDKFTYQPEKILFPFYQICRMHHPERTELTGKKVHEMRKIIYDEDFNPVSVKQAIISANRLQKFIDTAPENKYTLYETYEVIDIPPPTDLEIHTASSKILNGDSFLPAYQEGDGTFQYTKMENKRKGYFLDK